MSSLEGGRGQGVCVSACECVCVEGVIFALCVKTVLKPEVVAFIG